MESTNHISVLYLPKWVHTLCPHKNLHMDVYNNFIHDHQNVGSQPDVLQQVNGYIVSISYNWIFFSNKNKERTKTGQSLNVCCLSEKANLKRQYTTCWKDQWLLVLGRRVCGRDEWVGYRVFEGGIWNYSLILKW